jgi:hypothetical protein
LTIGQVRRHTRAGIARAVSFIERLEVMPGGSLAPHKPDQKPNGCELGGYRDESR